MTSRPSRFVYHSRDFFRLATTTATLTNSAFGSERRAVGFFEDRDDFLRAAGIGVSGRPEAFWSS
jgi:hypothetical protein